jgi:hypothetical protein
MRGLLIRVVALQDQNKTITTTCPICGKSESIIVTFSELAQARNQHSLLTKAVSHKRDGHVLTLYIDGEGRVRRKYCFELVQDVLMKFEGKSVGDLDSLFDKMLRDSLKKKKNNFSRLSGEK